MEGLSEFVDRRLQSKEALRRPIAAISAGSNGIGIDTGIAELEGFSGIIQGDRLMARQGNRRRRMFAISAGIPQRIEVNTANVAVLRGPEDDPDL